MHKIKKNTTCKVLSAAERRGTPVLLSASVSDNFSNSPQMAAPMRSREIDQSTQHFHVSWFHVGWQGIGDQSDAVTQNAWFRCALCAAISGEISILIQTGAESWGRFPVPRICRWESTCKDAFKVQQIDVGVKCSQPSWNNIVLRVKQCYMFIMKRKLYN